MRGLAAGEQDKRLRAWLRVRLGGEPVSGVAREMGYRDASGVTRVVQRLEALAARHRGTRQRLEELRRLAESPKAGGEAQMSKPDPSVL